MKRGLTEEIGTQIDKTRLLKVAAKLRLKEGAVIEEMTTLRERKNN